MKKKKNSNLKLSLNKQIIAKLSVNVKKSIGELSTSMNMDCVSTGDASCNTGNVTF
ncbi:hypothetical protein SAMN05518672_114158 [Chitinophaga sp. CF118]|nr:hypothetical protein SAMN05518672_114158 [Chitinophaga sp. CF118]